MARLGDQVQVKVLDKGVESGKRKVCIEIEAVEGYFYLTDALSREGVMKDLKTELKGAVRSGVLSYVQQSRECLRKLRGEGKPQKEIEKGRAR